MDQDSGETERARIAREAIAREYPGLTLGQFQEMLKDPERRQEAEPILRAMAEALGPAGREAGALLAEMIAGAGEGAAVQQEGGDREAERAPQGSIEPKPSGLTVGQLVGILTNPDRSEGMAPRLRAAAEPLSPGVRDAINLLAGLVAPVDLVREAVARVQSWVTTAVDSVAQLKETARQVPEMVAWLHEPYGRQIEAASEGRIPSLTYQEQFRLVWIALLLQSREEAEAGELPPLELVALVAERYDIAAPLLYPRYPGLARALLHAVEAPQADREEALQEARADAYLFLGGTFLQRVGRRARKLPPWPAREVLEGTLSEAYVMASLRHAPGERLRRERWMEQRTDRDVSVEDEVSGPERADSRLARMAVGNALQAYLSRSRSPALDIQIVRAMAAGTSMEALAKEMGVAATTLKYHRRQIVEGVKRLFQEGPEV